MMRAAERVLAKSRVRVTGVGALLLSESQMSLR
jgi:hypothetical protein